MVGCDEGKPVATDRRGGGRCRCVPGRDVPPPAGARGQGAAAAQSPAGDRRGRLADVGRHSMSAGAGQRRIEKAEPSGRGLDHRAPRNAGARVRTSPAERLLRSRSRAAWASSRRRRDVSQAKAPRAVAGAETNRELSGSGLTARVGAGLRPPLMTVRPLPGAHARRRPGGVASERRRDARPVRSGGRRGGDGQGSAGARTPSGTASRLRSSRPRRSRRRGHRSWAGRPQMRENRLSPGLEGRLDTPPLPGGAAPSCRQLAEGPGAFVKGPAPHAGAPL